MSSVTIEPTLLRVENVHINLPAPTHVAWTLRAQAVAFAQNPLRMFKSSERHSILKGVSFDVQSGERVGIIGRNGSGKTTLCRLIAGQIAPTTGRILTQASVTSISNTSAGIFPDLTGRENARILLHYLLPRDGGRHKDILHEALEFSDLGDWLDRPFRLYSTGMKTRLSLSLITSLESEILILDEVFDGADEEFRLKMRSRIQSMIDRVRILLFVSHSESQVTSVCQRVLVLNEGRIVFDGPAKKAYLIYRALMGIES